MPRDGKSRKKSSKTIEAPPKQVVRSRRPQRRRRPYARKLIPKGTFASGGRYLGEMVGGPVGGMLGGKLGELLAHISGFGDYQIQGNSLMEGGLSPPEIVNSVNRGGVIVRHREYLGDINAAQVFTVTNYAINPGLSTTFPWLAAIASAYEEYEFRGLIFEFKSLSSDAVLSSATSSALGYVAMATQYNAAAPNFQDKKALENYEYSNSSKPSCTFIHPVECKKRLNVDTHLYVRTGAVPTGQDQKTYDLGEFNIAVGGCQASTGVLGELWCTYEIELFHPRYIIDNGVLTDHFQCSACTATGNVHLGTSRVLGSGSNLGCSILTNNTIVFPNYIVDGEYYLSFNWSGTSIAVNQVTYTATNGCTLLSPFANDTSFLIQSPQSTIVCISYSNVIVAKITGPNATITMTGGAIPTNSLCDLFICEMALITT